ncbi:hypothetical protein SAMN05661091_0919 [Paenibacillus uliginis N3/975]|uniref:Uncharacterized protein n=1 Tax=Paenibacillus uliginis N3/975 TaxID=1313296 RepID=A0A1X7GR39_9BACL|nr:hypothetical protein SAMN05661091_0919 [Paenibacillus uliginis N3/975]
MERDLKLAWERNVGTQRMMRWPDVVRYYIVTVSHRQKARHTQSINMDVTYGDGGGLLRTDNMIGKSGKSTRVVPR